jgi:hypothetical protein
LTRNHFSTRHSGNINLHDSAMLRQ